MVTQKITKIEVAELSEINKVMISSEQSFVEATLKWLL